LECDSDRGRVFLIINAISCPNGECNKLFLRIYLATREWISYRSEHQYTVLEEWQLLPESEAKAMPEYVPSPIREDYEEACRIRDLSPKASATLARRCLQGMIRDFWNVSKLTLKEEIDELEEKVDEDTWASIDAVRRVGNIGAHMEKDINVIVDVEPDEAKLLIGLIEQLIEDWYIVRESRRKRSEELKKLVATKEELKNQGVDNG